MPLASRIRSYLLITRPQFWARSVGPLIAGMLLAGISTSSAFTLIIAIGSAIATTGGYKAVNDYFDRDIDTEYGVQRFRGLSFAGGSGLIQKGILKPVEAVVFGLLLLVSGLVISFFVNFAFALIVVIANLAGFLYSAPPFRLKARGMFGGAIRSMTYCLLAFNAGWVAATGQINLSLVAFGSLLTVMFFGIDELGNLLDYENDLRNGIRTFPIRVGKEKAAKALSFCQFSPFLIIGLLASMGLAHVRIISFVLVAGAVLIMAVHTARISDGRMALRIRFAGSVLEGLVFFIFA